jgi:hypothetical protein
MPVCLSIKPSLVSHPFIHLVQIRINSAKQIGQGVLLMLVSAKCVISFFSPQQESSSDCSRASPGSCVAVAREWEEEKVKWDIKQLGERVLDSERQELSCTALYAYLCSLVCAPRMVEEE